MTKDRLKKLRALIKEAEHLQNEINTVRFYPHELVADTYKDYRTGYPHVRVESGYGDSGYTARQQRLYDKLLRQLQSIQEEREVMCGWLNSVDDPELRDILRLQYINGLTQEQIADELGYSIRTIKRRLHEFWKDGL